MCLRSCCSQVLCGLDVPSSSLQKKRSAENKCVVTREQGTCFGRIHNRLSNHIKLLPMKLGPVEEALFSGNDDPTLQDDGGNPGEGLAPHAQSGSGINGHGACAQ